MKLTHTILFLAASAAGFAVLGQYRSAKSVASAQPVAPAAITVSQVHFRGVPRDWSHQHLLFSNPGTEAEATKAGTHDRWLKIVNDPRYVLQQLQRQQPGQGPAAAQVASLLATPHIAPAAAPDKKKKHRDWSMNLGAGNLLPNTYPAKWSFDTTKANCATDFVIFSTGASGSSSQATIVAYNNLYSGCGGTVPSVYWKYNTASNGVNSLSPILSDDGSQVAFMQSSGGVSSLVILKWAASTSLLSLSPTAAASYRNCTAPCMAVLPFSSGSLDGYASPYYDYANDIVYVGDNDGALHKFTGVFKGTPAETTAAPWPVALAGTLSSPVLDSVSGRIIVGSQNGLLYAVNSSTGAVAGTSSSLGGPNGVYDASLVDSSAGMVYAFAGGVYQFPVTFSSGSGTEVGVAVGNLPIFSGAFDNIYYTSNSSSPTGNLYVCGTTSTTSIQTLDEISIASNVMGSVSVLNNSSHTNFVIGFGASCSPVTEFYNTGDLIYLSSANGFTSTAEQTGLWYGFGVTSGSAGSTAVYGGSTGGASGIIVDNLVGSGTLAGASQLYFTTFGNTGTCATSGGAGMCGVQTSQLASSPTTCGCYDGNSGTGTLPNCGCPVQEPGGCPGQNPPCSDFYTYASNDTNTECLPQNANDATTYFGYLTVARNYSSCYDPYCVETGSCNTPGFSSCYPNGNAYISSQENCPLGHFSVSLYNSLGDLVERIYCSELPANDYAQYHGDLFHNCANTSYGGPFTNLPPPPPCPPPARGPACPIPALVIPEMSCRLSMR